MKRVIMIILLTYVSSVTHAVLSASPLVKSETRVIQTGEVVKVIHVSDKPCNVLVSIQDEHGKEVFSEWIRSKGGFIRPYNLSLLDEGVYQIQVSAGKETCTGVITNVYSIQEDKNHLFSPHVAEVKRPDGRKRFLLTLPESGLNWVSVTIYDQDNQVIHQATRDLTGDLTQLYRIEGYDGDLTFQVRSLSGLTKRFHFGE